MFFLQKRKFFPFLFIFIVFSTLFFSRSCVVFGQTSAISVVEDRRAELEQQLADLEREIAEKTKILNGQKQKSSSLTNEIAILKTKIDKAKLDIKAQNLTIQKLSGEITKKAETIESLSEKIEKEKDSLTQIIRKINEMDNSNITHIILGSKSISDFYSDFNAFNSINESLKISVDKVKFIKKTTEVEKTELQQKQDAEIDAKKRIEIVQKEIEKNQSEQKKLLSISKDKEKEYQKILVERAKKAAEIRSALFALRDTAAIPFGKALEYANFASEKTGVRPALILAILTQESNLGANTGSCYVTDLETGAGISSKSGNSFKNVMHATRDIPPFVDIINGFGGNPYKVLVSCPIASVGGYGGAMGPSQFIPSTWKLFVDKITKALDMSGAPNPWEPKDAIMASAIYLSNLGANAQTYTAERISACKYYAGGRGCSSAAGANYGNQVMAKAKNIQETMIDPLSDL